MWDTLIDCYFLGYEIWIHKQQALTRRGVVGEAPWWWLLNLNQVHLKTVKTQFHPNQLHRLYRHRHYLSDWFDALQCTVSEWTSHEMFVFHLCLYSATVVENSRMVEKNLPLSNLMACLPRTAEDGREQNKERLSTGTKFALRQWLKFLYPPPPGNLQRGDSFETVFHMLTKTGHQPMKAPFWGKWSWRLE